MSEPGGNTPTSKNQLAMTGNTGIVNTVSAQQHNRFAPPLRRGFELQQPLTFLISVFGTQFHRPGTSGDVIPTATAAVPVQRARRGVVRCARNPPALAAGAREGE